MPSKGRERESEARRYGRKEARSEGRAIRQRLKGIQNANIWRLPFKATRLSGTRSCPFSTPVAPSNHVQRAPAPNKIPGSPLLPPLVGPSTDCLQSVHSRERKIGSLIQRHSVLRPSCCTQYHQYRNQAIQLQSGNTTATAVQYRILASVTSFITASAASGSPEKPTGA